MPPALFADVAVWPILVVFGGMAVAGVFAAVGVAWLGVWLVRRNRRQAERIRDEVR